MSVKHLLTEILCELRTIRRSLQKDEADEAMPYVPYLPEIGPRPVEASQCSRCGLRLDGVLSYSCADPKCPTGLGPTIS